MEGHRSCTSTGCRWSICSRCATRLLLRRATCPQSTEPLSTGHEYFGHCCSLANVLCPDHQVNMNCNSPRLRRQCCECCDSFANVKGYSSITEAVSEKANRSIRERHVESNAPASTFRLHRYSHIASCDTHAYVTPAYRIRDLLLASLVICPSKIALSFIGKPSSPVNFQSAPRVIWIKCAWHGWLVKVFQTISNLLKRNHLAK
jgi:hypothetical protein